MIDLIREVDKRASERFKKSKDTKQAVFLSQFWDDHCPTFSRLYVDILLGKRHINASQHFYNDPDFLTPDYWVHTKAPDLNDLNRAVDLLNRLLSVNPDDAIALIAKGYVRLELGAYEQADRAFLAALKSYRKEPSIYNGRGLAWVKRRNGQSVAREHFRDALALDRGYEAASYNLAMSQVATRPTDVPYHIKKVTKTFPDHHDAYYKLGVWHEIRSRFDDEYVAEAMDAYRAQTIANPRHYAAWSNLARMRMKSGQPEAAIDICRRVLDEAPAYRIRVLPTLMEAYQAVNHFAEADAAALRYIEMLDPETRRHFQDIRLISSQEENVMVDQLNGAEREAFLHDFWVRHDPTPGTPENEKRVEHVRRVGNAMVLFSEAVKPWDVRGDVYVRYGDPRHKSRSDNIRFEVDPYVVRVRDRLLGSLSDDERNQIRQFHRRIRTSTRDVEVVDGDGSFEIVVSNFEPAEFGLGPAVGDKRIGRSNPNAREYQPGLIESINDRMAPADIRGVPLFPVEGNRPWEYWIYPDVDNGIEVVFTALNQHGGYGFAEPSNIERKIARRNQLTFVKRRPEHVIASARARQPSLLRMSVSPMSFAYDVADFRGQEGKSLVEVYIGKAAGSVGETVTTDVSMILYDKNWNPIFDKSERLSRSPTAAEDSLNILTLDGQLPAGEYILAMQVDDLGTSAMGAQRMGIAIEDYGDISLAISDIAFASRVVEDETNRGGVRITPFPWRDYAASDPVVVYYEIYGLSDDAFGQTQYRMDYRITPLDGGSLSAKVLRGIGRQLGIDKKESLIISYEQTGENEVEYSYVEIDVSGSATGSYEVAVTITDTVTGQQASKRRSFRIRGEETSGMGGGIPPLEMSNAMRLK